MQDGRVALAAPQRARRELLRDTAARRVQSVKVPLYVQCSRSGTYRWQKTCPQGVATGAFALQRARQNTHWRHVAFVSRSGPAFARGWASALAPALLVSAFVCVGKSGLRSRWTVGDVGLPVLPVLANMSSKKGACSLYHGAGAPAHRSRLPWVNA